MGGAQNNNAQKLFFHCFLLFILVVSSNSFFAIECQDTIIVNQDGSGDYTTIRAAVNTALSGDVILVHSGVYEEDAIFINTSLTLTGENIHSTIISGGGETTIFVVNADQVTISGLTITGGGGNLGQNIDIAADDCIISNNIITLNDDVGIAIHNSSNSLIESNVIRDCPFAAIRIYNTIQPNIIKDNQISDCISGIYVYNAQNQKIEQNLVSGCSKGIYLEECTNNVVTHNQIFNNSQGMFVSYAKNNRITENNFITNEEQAKFNTWLSPTGLQISKWNNNYWDDSITFFPKYIPGIMFIRTYNPLGIFIPWASFDWHPAKESFEIDKDI